MDLVSSRRIYACPIPGCPRTFSRSSMLQKHVHDHKTLRRDVGLPFVLKQLCLPSPAVSLCCVYIGKPTALSYLNPRFTDMHPHETRLDAQTIMPLLSQACSEHVLRTLRTHSAMWTYERCWWTRQHLLRIINRLVTAANGRGHPINTRHRAQAETELDYVLWDTWGENWRHRGLP